MNYQQAEQTAVALADCLDEMARITADNLALGDLGRDLHMRAESVRADRFKIVVVGGFSRGKSTLLNAVLGCDILPQKVTPSTAIITVIEYADQPSACVHSAGEPQRQERLTLEEFRRRYVLDETDFTDRVIETDRFSQVDHAVVYYPVELCRHRVELVDSPGLQDDPVRTARTRKFLKRADAVVMVLDATTLLTQEEVQFLENTLLPGGFTNIFFVINKWNLIADSVLRPEDAEQEFANLEARIRDRLRPFSVIDGVDRSKERIFRVNALGALRARLRKPPAAGMLEESQVPAFEASLQRFLVADRGRARNDLIGAVVKTTMEEVRRYIAMQTALADRSLGEIEAQREALQPKLDRLRGIRQHILGFLDAQSLTLQDRLVISLENLIKKIDADLLTEVEKFDLKEILGSSMVVETLVDRFRKDENKFAKKVERVVRPQVQRLLERRFAAWQQSIVANEMGAVAIDVKKHLQEEAAEYQRVMHEIEAKVGIHTDPLQTQELVERWLVGAGGGDGRLDLSGLGVLGDISWLFGATVFDVVAQVVLHVSSFWIPVVGLLITAVRLMWRERQMRKQVRGKIVTAIHEALANVVQAKKAALRQVVKEAFDGLKQKIGGSIDQEIGLIDASMQTIIDRKKERQFSADQEKARLESILAGLEMTSGRLKGLILAAGA